MTTQCTNNVYNTQVSVFFEALFGQILTAGLGEIEIRAFLKNSANRGTSPLPQNSPTFHSDITDTIRKSYELSCQGYDVYFGVNPRVGKSGKKDNVHHIVTFHADIDCGKEGHKKDSHFATIDKALSHINNLNFKPSIVINSGGGLHCYWMLKEPVEVKAVGIDKLEAINRALSELVFGDKGTSDITRILRVPDTFNYKNINNPRQVKMVYIDEKRYDLSEMLPLLKENANNSANQSTIQSKSPVKNYCAPDIFEYIPIQSTTQTKIISKTFNINSLQVSPKIKNLIVNGNDGSYPSRSEVDLAVMIALLKAKCTEEQIKAIYKDVTLRVGEKYRGHQAREKYFQATLRKAMSYSLLTDEELANPLFQNLVLYKDTKDGHVHLNLKNFEEYLLINHSLVYADKHLYYYDDNYYKQCDSSSLNRLSQKILGKYRHLFRADTLNSLIHFLTGNPEICRDEPKDENRYLNMPNGLFDLKDFSFRQHAPLIFTRHRIPYEYKPNAQCPLFIKTLKEMLEDDTDTIAFLQEYIGSIYLREIKNPSILFLIGKGSNGKSLLLNTILNLVGKENSCTIGLHQLSQENYLCNLFNKLVNLVSETVHNKCISFGTIKALTSGDQVSGKSVYKDPFSFRPYAKHIICMNEMPDIDDYSYGMERRLYIVEFNKIFTTTGQGGTCKADPLLEDKLKLEMSGIFNWAMEGLRRFINNGYVFTSSKRMVETKQRYLTRNDSAAMFIKHCVKKSAGKSVRFGEVYNQYLCFCQDNIFARPKRKIDLKQDLLKAGYRIDNSTIDNQLTVYDVLIDHNI